MSYSLVFSDQARRANMDRLWKQALFQSDPSWGLGSNQFWRNLAHAADIATDTGRPHRYNGQTVYVNNTCTAHDSCGRRSNAKRGQRKETEELDAVSKDNDQEPSSIGLLMLGSALVLCATGVYAALSHLIQYDWRYKGFATYVRRFSRGTQMLQSIAELAFSTLGGALTVHFTYALMVSMATMSSVPAVMLTSSMLLPMLVNSTLAMAFMLGFLLGNMGAVALVRWWCPLGTGMGRARMHHTWCERSTALLSTESITSSEMTSSDNPIGPYQNAMSLFRNNRQPQLRDDQLDNQIDTLRKLKKVVDRNLYYGAFEENEKSAYGLIRSLRAVISGLKQPYPSQHDQSNMLSSVEKAKDYFDCLSNSRPDIFNHQLDDLVKDAFTMTSARLEPESTCPLIAAT
ncbi:MAG: hypothetical protein CMF52_04755 [Legionellales bacterium]|nr:hypothetical protein [Legionellales bacterium]